MCLSYDMLNMAEKKVSWIDYPINLFDDNPLIQIQ
jgi:hypothetical protein